MEPHASQLADLHWIMDTLQSVDAGLIILDRDYRIKLWNSFMSNHSGLPPHEVRERSLFELFPDIPQNWLRRKIQSVLLLNSRTFSTWEQRPYLLRFDSYRPFTGEAEYMYQDFSIIPLSSVDGSIEHVCIILYDVTDIAERELTLRQLNQHLQHLSEVDGLTSLCNRRFWEEQMRKEFLRCGRSGHQSSLVMLDIDHFKKVNDNYGHQAGDEVIRTLARILREEGRETDTPGRYGGEEFGVILPDTAEAPALNFTERVRRRIEQTPVVWEGQTIHFTISLGVAQIAPHQGHPEQWLIEADQALYHAKSHGRNRSSRFTETLGDTAG